jgi:hypothetical protein
MAGTLDTKSIIMDHVEDSHKPTVLGDMMPHKEQRDAETIEEKYHIPMKAVLESQLDQDPKKVKRIMRKVDLRLIPILSLLYMWAFVDRSNLGNVCAPIVNPVCFSTTDKPLYRLILLA